jgi:NitT/TauT family transport system permease protein
MTAKSEDAELYQSQAQRQAKRRYRRGVVFGQMAIIAMVIVVWQFGSGRWFDPFFVGSPLGVGKILLNDFGDVGFYHDLQVTGFEMAGGFLIGSLGGIGLGVLFARWRFAADIADPFFNALNSLPRIALAPLLVIWFGIDMASKVVLAATLVFFLMFFTTLSGIRSVDTALIDVARLVGANDRQIFRYIMLPGAAAWIISGSEDEFALRLDRRHRRRVSGVLEWPRLPPQLLQHVLQHQRYVRDAPRHDGAHDESERADESCRTARTRVARDEFRDASAVLIKVLAAPQNRRPNPDTPKDTAIRAASQVVLRRCPDFLSMAAALRAKIRRGRSGRGSSPCSTPRRSPRRTSASRRHRHRLPRAPAAASSIRR